MTTICTLCQVNPARVDLFWDGQEHSLCNECLISELAKLSEYLDGIRHQTERLEQGVIDAQMERDLYRRGYERAREDLEQASIREHGLVEELHATQTELTEALKKLEKKAKRTTKKGAK